MHAYNCTYRLQYTIYWIIWLEHRKWIYEYRLRIYIMYYEYVSCHVNVYVCTCSASAALLESHQPWKPEHQTRYVSNLCQFLDFSGWNVSDCHRRTWFPWASASITKSSSKTQHVTWFSMVHCHFPHKSCPFVFSQSSRRFVCFVWQ